jgi:hypothetical protein
MEVSLRTVDVASIPDIENDEGGISGLGIDTKREDHPPVADPQPVASTTARKLPHVADSGAGVGADTGSDRMSLCRVMPREIGQRTSCAS